MLLTKDGVTFEVFSPMDIARLKRAGYVEDKFAPKVEKDQRDAPSVAKEPKEKK